MRVGSRALVAMLGFGALANGFGEAAASSANTTFKYVHCDFEYTIQQGDTLAGISEDAYGAQHQQLLFARNSDQIDMLGALPVGQKIIIPCVPGDEEFTPDEETLEEAMLRAAWKSTRGVSSTETNRIAGANAEDVLRLLTADGQAPYVDSVMRNGGFFAELVSRAFAANLGNRQTETVFVNDRKVHLTDLLQEGSFDIGFPWLRPPCEARSALSRLSKEAVQLCEDFVFSEPVFEAVSGFFVRTDESATFEGYESFLGHRICAPDGESLIAFGVKGLTPETTSIFRSATPAGCIGMLIVGEVDAVIADSNGAARAIENFGAADRINERTDLSLLKSLHAIAPASKPNALTALVDLNNGLRTIRTDGRWFQIVREFLALQ